ncbi:MAG: hypothetical protein U1D33_03230 [bacterium]|nr:hypothetical protein [bacterium]
MVGMTVVRYLHSGICDAQGRVQKLGWAMSTGMTGAAGEVLS